MARVNKSKGAAPSLPGRGVFGLLLFSLLATLYLWGKKLNTLGLQEFAAIAASFGVIYIVSKYHDALQAYFKK